MALVTVTEFTDPACPFAWSAEPSRWRLRWRYGDQIEWTLRMVVLSETVAELEQKGLTPARLAAGAASLSRRYGMPMTTDDRELSASLPACRAIVAARLHAGENAAATMLRTVRIRNFSGQPLDAPETIAGAARDAGIDPELLAGWIDDPATEQALQADMDAARNPTPASLAQSDRLATWSGGKRYTCPSYELSATDRGAGLSVPGFQPDNAYDVAFANAIPEAEIRSAPSSVAELLAWAAEPLATQEVAVVCGIEPAEARAQLTAVATEQPVGNDGFWTLA